MSTITEYFESLRGKSIAVIGMGVSNTPLIRMLLRANLKVTVCDKSPRERVEEQAAELMCYFCYAVGMSTDPLEALPDAPDAADITAGYEDYFAYLISMGAMEVREDGSVAPQELATRGEYALMLLALLAA